MSFRPNFIERSKNIFSKFGEVCSLQTRIKKISRESPKVSNMILKELTKKHRLPNTITCHLPVNRFRTLTHITSSSVCMIFNYFIQTKTNCFRVSLTWS